ncbi:MAG: VWA domain-containing protein [Ruminococcus flavefaciens]|nr:VWA domain-containing protein [Ruminococcus flavefaciens]
MDNYLLFREKDLEENPTTRVPICLCLDTSGSMCAVEGNCVPTGETVFEDGREWEVVTGGTTRIDELQKGIELFYEAIKADDVAKNSAEICIVTFNNSASCILDFANIERQGEVPKLDAQGSTAMGEGVNLALDLLEKCKQEYKDKGVDYYQPWLVIMSDGVPNGSTAEMQRAIDRITEMTNNRKLTVFAIGIGNEADKSALSSLSPKRSPLKLQGLKFQEFFEWLGKSVSRTSQSVPGERVNLDSPDVWAEGWDNLYN